MKHTPIFKNLILILAVGTCTYCISCSQAEEETEAQTMIERIAADETYAQYRKAVYAQAYHINLGMYDLDAIGAFIRKHDVQNMCDDLPMDELKEIDGGPLYQKSMCTINTAAKDLEQQFPDFWSLSEDVRLKIREEYRRITGDTDFLQLSQHANPTNHEE